MDRYCVFFNKNFFFTIFIKKCIRNPFSILEFISNRVIFVPSNFCRRARSSVVEQHPFKVKVGGSSPPALTD